MNYTNTDKHIKALYEYAESSGFAPDSFFSLENVQKYVETSIDGYNGYPLFMNVFNGKYSEKTLRRMMTVDYKSRLSTTAGLSSGENFESVMMLEPPCPKKVGIPEYVKVAKPSDYTLLLIPAMHRQEDYEKYATKKMTPFLDDRTWYIYVFATKQEFQRQGYGKKIMNLILSFADENEYKICLETNLSSNVAMYESFGFKTVDVSVYKDTLEHYVMKR